MKRKLLALTLTLAVLTALLSPALAAEGDSSHFSDEKDITHLEAVTSLVRLGVMKGKEDGSYFDPKGSVTRGECARFVVLILRGGEDIVIPANAPAADPAFPDVAGHWAETYINYCAEKNVVFAQADGNFDPNGSVTYFELLRMAEVALGEDPTQYAKAQSWIGMTHAAALTYNLFTGLDNFTDKSITDHLLTRDEAAQILYNALNATPKVIGSTGYYEDVKRPDGATSTLLYENFGYASWGEVPPLPEKEKPGEPKSKTPKSVDPTTFADAKDIQYWPAVASLAKLGVVNGKDDGAFHPTGNVTRAEAAKLIAFIMNGGIEANTGAKREPTFTDIQGHWAEGWIEYCADMGIVNGAGDGTFDPDGSVTVQELAKMTLTTLGYDAAAYRLTGSRWADQVNELARMVGIKLYNGLENLSYDQPASREVAAQLLCNALQATTIETVPDKNTSSEEIVWAHQASSKTLLQVRFGLNELPTIPAQPTT